MDGAARPSTLLALPPCPIEAEAGWREGPAMADIAARINIPSTGQCLNGPDFKAIQAFPVVKGLPCRTADAANTRQITIYDKSALDTTSINATSETACFP
jgi:hypothetical protein